MHENTIINFLTADVAAREVLPPLPGWSISSRSSLRTKPGVTWSYTCTATNIQEGQTYQLVKTRVKVMFCAIPMAPWALTTSKQTDR